jgi:hypothetical protein
MEDTKMKKPRMLLVGMPGADSSFYEMNIAQLPQGPRLHVLEWLFNALEMSPVNRRRIRMALKLENLFNPSRQTPYMGMRLIEYNLRDYLDISLMEYPKSNRWIANHLKDNPDIAIVGLGIGCENRVYQAKKLCAMIRKARPDIRIILGSYGASAGKKLGVLTPEDGTVLWDSEEEREAKKKKGLDFYKGEGVHDIRLWLRDAAGIDAGDPNTPLVSEAIADSGSASNEGWKLKLKGRLGFVTMPKDSHKLVSAIGCSNKCGFCNTSKMFNREKTYLYQNAEKIFVPMETVYDRNAARNDYPPEATFFLMDENFMKDEKVMSACGMINFLDTAKELCGYIEHSGKNMHFGTFSDIRSLVNVRQKDGDFKSLVRGGLTSIWIGIESRGDVFDKRGGATPETVRSIVDELQSLGVVVIGSFIPGLPYHTEGPTRIFSDEERVREEIRKAGDLTAEQVEARFAEIKQDRVRSGKFDRLNIWEDFEWWKSLRTGARQVMSHSITGIVGLHKHMFSFSDYQFGHKFIPGYNESHIDGRRLEAIDEKMRAEFYRENGPVALSSLLVMWRGFMNLKDSANDAELRAATFNYWMVRRNLQRVILASFAFNDRVFTKCSGAFLSRLAEMFDQAGRYAPPDTAINRKYQAVFEMYDRLNSARSKAVARKMADAFIRRHAGGRLGQDVIDAIAEPVAAPL